MILVCAFFLLSMCVQHRMSTVINKEAGAGSNYKDQDKGRDYTSLIVIVALVLVLSLPIARVLQFFKSLFDLSDFCQNR
jgi:hypothetical protein